MKKSLIALAALAATASFAQSSVTITGLFDVGYKAVSNNKNDTAKFGGIGTNNTGTSAVIFKGVEDLGGGLKASFLAEIDHNPAQSTTMNLASTAAGGSQAYTGTPFNGEQYVGLSGAFGDVKLGTPNSPALTAGTTSQPFGTALGGGWSSGFGRLGTAAASGLNQYVGGPSSGGRIIRSEKAVVYTTPTFSGFNAQIEYSAKNANSGTFASNDNEVLGLAANYNNGPLNVAYYNGKATAGAVQAAGSANAGDTSVANTLAANQNVKWNILGANYTIGATTLYAGYTTTKASQAAVEDSKSWNVAAKYVIGNIDLLANYLERKSNLAAQDDATHTPKAKLLGLGANYNLSKRTALYARYEQIQGLNVSAADAANGVAAVAAAGGATLKTTAIGVRHTF